MRKLILAASLALASLFAGHAHAACPAINPNLFAPPFYDGCQVPAVALNNLSSASVGVNVMAFAAGVPINNGVADAGPAIRAACVYAEANHNAQILFIPGTYMVLTADPNGSWGISTGTGTADGKTCNMAAQIGTDFGSPNGTNVMPVTIKLGPGLNVPLIYIPQQGSSPHFTYLAFDGNMSGQSGDAGGPAASSTPLSQLMPTTLRLRLVRSSTASPSMEATMATCMSAPVATRGPTSSGRSTPGSPPATRALSMKATTASWTILALVVTPAMVSM